MLTIKTVSEMSASRAARWHDGKPKWSLLEWSGAMAGEAGEACNAAKKLKRIDDDTATINEASRHYESKAEAIAAITKEAADTLLYSICLLNECGVDAESIIREVFNKKSEEYGFPERV